MSCPNLRFEKTGKGLVFAKGYNWCSATHKQLDTQYVNNICNKLIYNGNGNGMSDAYKSCNTYKIYGIRNSN